VGVEREQLRPGLLSHRLCRKTRLVVQSPRQVHRSKNYLPREYEQGVKSDCQLFPHLASSLAESGWRALGFALIQNDHRAATMDLKMSTSQLSAKRNRTESYVSEISQRHAHVASHDPENHRLPHPDCVATFHPVCPLQSKSLV